MKITQALFLAALLAAAGAFPLSNQARDLPPDAYVPNAYQMAAGQGSAQFDGPHVTTPSDDFHQKRDDSGAYAPNAFQMASGQGSAQFDGPYVTAPSDGFYQKREKELKHEPIHLNPNDGLIIIDDGHPSDYKTE